ncbi:SHOCT domain-containing protein [Pediococcus acidilactici]
MTAFEGFLFSKGAREKLVKIANEKIPNYGSLYVAIQGAYKEYLFATDDAVFIIKQGYMTGHTFGDGIYKYSYQNIANINVEYHLMSGYFELLTNGSGGHKPMNYWLNDKETDPAKQPNCISINSKADFKGFQQVADKILRMAAEVQSSSSPAPVPQSDYTDELIKLKQLVEAGVLTQAEFDAKKKQILGL